MSISTLTTASGSLDDNATLRPPFDPTLETARNSAFLDPNIFLSVSNIRAQPDSFSLDSFLSKFTSLAHEEYTIPGPSRGSTVTLSVFTPKGSTGAKRPAVYNVHGGGQIAGTRFAGIEGVADWFAGLDVVLITVEYRLAPEHPAPAALDDSFTGLVWVADHCADLGVDPLKIMVVGVSGGGPIAAACAIQARNRQHPHLCGQLLSTPMLDSRVDTVSSLQFETLTHWSGRTNRMAWGCVLGQDANSAEVSELVSPSRATDLAGVAPAFIDAGEAEVFRDEAVAYASTLWKSGVSAELHVWPGAWHGFDMLAPEALVSKAATAAKKDWIRRLLFN
ncbi:Alpha/Beta hydrolase protein [Aspergillus pseudoustus]|uniref:Alpha/Beta hydrolase protein n=1 Tax=Aspergillus pseudoustus TaxID=1810923 RepID=A0ABR4JI79_9EURO